VATSLSGLASLLTDEADYAGAQSLYDRALVIQEKTLGPDDTAVAETLNNLAVADEYQGTSPRRARSSSAVLTINEKQLGPEDPSVAMSLRKPGLCHQRSGRPHRPHGRCWRAPSRSRRRRWTPEPPAGGEPARHGSLLKDLGEFVEARRFYDSRARDPAGGRGPDDPGLAKHLEQPGTLLDDQGDFAGARQAYEKSLAIFEKALGAESSFLGVR